MKGVTKMKKKLSCRIGLARRLVALVCVTALLFSCLPVGVAKQDVKVVKAVAVVDDFCSWFAAQSMMSLFTLACAAGGASSSEYLTSSEKAGITDFPSAKNYVHGSLSGNSNFGKIFSFDPVKMIKTECSIASMSLKMGYTLNKSFFEKLWGTYSPDKEAWDPEKWDTLTEEEKKSYVFSWDKFIEKLNASAPFPPDPDYDFDDEEDTSSEYNEKGEHINSSTGEPDVMPIGTTSDIIASAPFALIYALTKIMNEEDIKKKFGSNTTQNSKECDYSFRYWKENPQIAHIQTTNTYEHEEFSSKYTYCPYLDLSFNFNESIGYDNYKIYPVLYKDSEDHYSYSFITNVPTDSDFSFYHSRYSNQVYGRLYSTLYTFDYQYDLKKKYEYEINLNYDNKLRYYIDNWALMNPKTTSSDLSLLLDIGTKDNIAKFQDIINKNVFEKDEILKILKDGWKADRKKSFESVEDGGKTTKKILESEKGDKYTTSGTKKDEKGNTQSNQRGVTYGSIAEGLGSPDGIKGILGDMVNRSNPIKYPSPEAYPGEIGNPQPDPAPTPEPDPDPEPNPTPVPGAGSKPTPVPGADNELENIDPDKVKTPQLLKKFPFCIPWDIVDLVTALSAEKKAPKFELPFKLNSKQSKQVNIDEKIVIDFSKYESLANICRWFFRLMFIAGLVVLTRYVIKG